MKTKIIKHLRLASACILLFSISMLGQVSTRPIEGQISPTLRNAVYVEGGSKEQTLDFYWPTKTPTATVLFIHGGGLVEIGERRSSDAYKNVCIRFVSAGIACATMDYRLAPSHKWPAMPNDVAAAIVKVRHLITERKGNPDRLFLFGHSSGCQLAAIVGTEQQYLRRVSLSTKNIAGIVPMGCVLDRWDAAFRNVKPEMIRERFVQDEGETDRYTSAEDLLSANPSFHLGPHVPKTLVILADDERFTPPILEQGSRFVRRLRELKVRAEIVIVPGTHMSSISEFGQPKNNLLNLITEFMNDRTRQ
jgi:acetyl esterase/lipase